MSKISIHVVESGLSELRVPVRMSAATRTSRTIHFTHYSSPQQINVRISHATPQNGGRQI